MKMPTGYYYTPRDVVQSQGHPEASVTHSNVVGGSLDGASIPNGTRDGQKLVWDAKANRWRG